MPSALSLSPVSPVPSALSLSPVSPVPPVSSLSPLPSLALLPAHVCISSSISLGTTTAPPLRERDLSNHLKAIWHHYFADLSRVNEVQIAYCKPWKTRLGLIRLSLDNAVSFIGINALLRSTQVPEYVLITTIAHELVHYAHGFGSPLPRLYEHPHANCVVEKELEQRGLGTALHACDSWIEEKWFDFYAHRKTGFAQKIS